MSSSTSAEPMTISADPSSGALDYPEDAQDQHGEEQRAAWATLAARRISARESSIPPSPERDVKVISHWYRTGQYGPGSLVRRSAVRESAGSQRVACDGSRAQRAPSPRTRPAARTTALEADPQVGDERQVVGGHQRLAGARQLDAAHLDVALVIDVIEVDDGKDARIGAAPLQVGVDVDALEERAAASCVASPRIHSLKSPRMIFGPLMRWSWTNDASRGAW